MKKLIPSVLFALVCFTLKSQEVKWAMNVPDPPFQMDMATDLSSNIYLYGSSEIDHRHDLEGSVFRKYSPSGQLLITKEWKSKLFITRMVNDGMGHFYFCGRFRGTISESGFTLNSRGGTDACFGKMDENGNIKWAISFGGARDESLNDLCFNTDSTAIVVVGGVDSTMNLYGYDVQTPPRAVFIGSFDLQGGLNDYRTYSFTNTEYGKNVGLEIAPDGRGGYYLLADRMGDHWSNETTPSGSPMEGRYVFSLDNTLRIRWSRFIISSGCYYGYSCNGMSVINGQACVPSFCSGKYGGTGRMQKLDEVTGSTSFSLVNVDGSYYDTHSTSGGLLYVGNEEANGCPCEDNNPGFARVKLLDDRNSDRVLLSKYGYKFYNITAAKNGHIFVFGHTNRGDEQLQGHNLHNGYILFAMTTSHSSSDLVKATEESVVVHPNPSSDYLEIVDNKMMSELSLFNNAGTLVRDFKPNAKSWTITGLEPGYYIVRAKNEDGYKTGKIVVVK